MATSWTRVDQNGNPIEWAEVAGVNDGNAIPSHSVLSDLSADDHPQYLTVGRSGSISHTAIADIGTNTHAQLDTAVTNSVAHIADATLHFTEASVDHTAITGIGTNSHATIDTHIADTTIHYADAPNDAQQYIRQSEGWVVFAPAAFGVFRGTWDASLGTFPSALLAGDWYTVSNAGTVDGEVFATGDTLVALIDTPSTTVFAANWDKIPNTNITDHTLLTNIGTNSHAAIDTHIADATLHYTQGSISVPLSQGANDVTATAAEVNLLDLSGLTAGWTLVADTATTASWQSATGAPDQNIFESVLSDSGTAVADTTTDTLSILGGTGISTAVVADALTITNDSPNVTHTGQVTGATALTIDVTAITDQPSSGAIISGDTILTNDGGVLSETTFTQLDTYFNSSLGFQTVTELSGDTTPVLGGNLDVAGNSIISVSNGDIVITPHGTGRIRVTALEHPLNLETQTGTTYTALTLDHADEMITMNNASANSVTIPANASIAYPIGTKLHFQQLGAGATTIAITSDTLNVNANLTKVLNGQYAVATAIKMTATTWTLMGNLVAA